MNISIKWQQIAEQEVWKIFPVEDILNRSRNHALDLFRRNIPVIIKEGDAIISNSMEMRNIYRRKSFKVYDLVSIQPSTGLLQEVGFITDV
jgi:hypothetical protein